MKHYYFIENNTGEEFLVGAKTLKEAEIIAYDVGVEIANNYGETGRRRVLLRDGRN